VYEGIHRYLNATRKPAAAFTTPTAFTGGSQLQDGSARLRARGGETATPGLRLLATTAAPTRTTALRPPKRVAVALVSAFHAVLLGALSTCAPLPFGAQYYFSPITLSNCIALTITRAPAHPL
jgi:hypothetical protein